MKIVPLLLSCLCSQLLSAQTLKHSGPAPALIRGTKGLIDSMVSAHATAQNFSSWSYAVVTRDGIAFRGVLGISNRKLGLTADSNTRYRIASMTKSITALAILKLRDEGKLGLDDPAHKYIPQLSRAGLTKDAAAITIRHLLAHSAGFPEDNPWGDRQLDAKESDLIALAQNPSLSTATGSGYEYSNLGYALLGQVISRVTRMTHQQYITSSILVPLGMKNTVWEYSAIPVKQLAQGYRRNGKDWEEEQLLHDGAYGAMGGLITTIADFSLYMQLHLQAWPPRDEKENGVIRRSSLREMQQPATFASMNTGFQYSSGRRCATTASYAFGLRWMHDCEGKTFVGHSGGLPGFGSNWQILPDYGIGVVLFANETYASTSAINLNILDTIIKRTGLQKRTFPVSGVLHSRKEALLAFLPHWNGAESSELFAVNFFKDRLLQDWKKSTTALYEKLGKVESIGEMKAMNNLRGSFIIKGNNGSALVYFTLTPEAYPKIQELRITLQ